MRLVCALGMAENGGRQVPEGPKTDPARGDRIKQLRDARGLTQEQVVRELGMTHRAYQYWEEGRTIPPQRVEALAKVLRTTPGIIRGDEPFSLTQVVPIEAGRHEVHAPTLEAFSELREDLQQMKQVVEGLVLEFAALRRLVADPARADKAAPPKRSPRAKAKRPAAGE